MSVPSATSEPKGPVYLWARRETSEEEIDPSIAKETLSIEKWPAVDGSALSAPGMFTD